MTTTQDKEHNAIIDLIPAYALNSLDTEEAGRVTQHLGTCAVCQAELASFESVVDALPLAAREMEPNSALKDQLMRQIQKSHHMDMADSNLVRPSLRYQLTATLSGFFSKPGMRPVALLIVLALLVSTFFIWQQLNPPTTQFLLTATEVAPNAQGIIEVKGNGRQATLTVTGLPELDPENQYQLWLIKDGQRVSGGVFSVNADGSQNMTIDAPQPLVNYAAFGITIEPAGGSPGPTGERVLEHNL